jgi:hypothetical protein
MWSCPKCNRIFQKENQPHSCRSVSLEQHFQNKQKAKKLFDFLVDQINHKIGKCSLISLPCCVHLFGNYDFLAAFPKKDKLEIRFSLDRVLDSPKLIQSVPVSLKYYKNCLDIYKTEEIDDELIKWLTESYHLKK